MLNEGDKRLFTSNGLHCSILRARPQFQVLVLRCTMLLNLFMQDIDHNFT